MRYGVWAGSGEMDLYEMKNDFTQCNFALHYGGPWPKFNKRYNLYNPREGGGSFSNDFTTVALDWSPTEITMLMNGVEQLSKKSRGVDPNGYYSDAINAPDGAPFNIPFYMIINLSVGGRYPGNATDATVLPNSLTLDYVRVFGKN
jgi:beta-glucanase (GH16 family)